MWKFLILIILLIYNSFAKEDVGMYEKQGQTIPLELQFTNEYNNKISLKEVIENKPTILSINYFKCTGLCSPQLHSLAFTLDKLDLKPYIDYKVITVSMEPKDTPKDALEKKQELLKTIKKSFIPQTWSFLTSNQETIDSITNSVGFKYKKRIKDGVVDYLHPGLLIIISPQGKITRYLNGIEYLPFDLKLALLEATKEEIRPTIAKTLLYCFAYDAKSKTYVFQAEKVVGSFIFAVVLIFFIFLVRGGRKKG